MSQTECVRLSVSDIILGRSFAIAGLDSAVNLNLYVDAGLTLTNSELSDCIDANIDIRFRLRYLEID